VALFGSVGCICGSVRVSSVSLWLGRMSLWLSAARYGVATVSRID